MLKVTFTGHLLADPELNYAQNERGTEYCRMRVGLNKKKGDDSLFAVADVTTFKFTQEANQRLRTGSRVLIAGDAFPAYYETKDGDIVAKLDVIADSWEDLERHDDGSRAQGNASARRSQPSGQQGGGRPAGNAARSRAGYGRSSSSGGSRRPTSSS